MNKSCRQKWKKNRIAECYFIQSTLQMISAFWLDDNTWNEGINSGFVSNVTVDNHKSELFLANLHIFVRSFLQLDSRKITELWKK